MADLHLALADTDADQTNVDALRDVNKRVVSANARLAETQRQLDDTL